MRAAGRNFTAHTIVLSSAWGCALITHDRRKVRKYADTTFIWFCNQDSPWRCFNNRPKVTAGRRGEPCLIYFPIDFMQRAFLAVATRASSRRFWGPDFYVELKSLSILLSHVSLAELWLLLAQAFTHSHKLGAPIVIVCSSLLRTCRLIYKIS